jgi:DNA repair exonuclease SbcCD ATPase subunit
VCNKLRRDLLSQSKKSEKSVVADLTKARRNLDSFGTIHPENHITKADLLKLGVGDDIRKLKAIQRERLLEDLSSLLNDKIRDFEKHEQEQKWKETVLLRLNTELDEKIAQLELANKQLADEKARSDDLNKQLQEALLKLQKSEEQLKLERDWLAQQVETKSKEVLETIREMIKDAEKQENDASAKQKKI